MKYIEFSAKRHFLLHTGKMGLFNYPLHNLKYFVKVSKYVGGFRMTEKLLDSENWKLEAEAVIRDIRKHVRDVVVLNGTDTRIYLNLITLEDKDYCIELSGNGFRVVGTRLNEINCDCNQYYETPYSLLNEISPQFQQSFGNELLNKLKQLDNM